jgi:AraC family transcriptional regulator of adaptative response/methylated-DNA-[protein]-cysteine methyltransferase
VDSSRDYQIVAEAIRFLRREFRQQPDLADVARHVGLSPFHFQRLFTRWAGVSPKRFLQFLTVEHAKGRLRASEPVLRAAFESGLSGPSRLHDLLVTTEAVTPGQVRSWGAALEIEWGIASSPFGAVLIGVTGRGICHLWFLEEADEDGSRALHALRNTWPRARLTHAPGTVRTLPGRIFRRLPDAEDPRPLALLLKGTNFQIQVWRALLQIPPGRIISYGRLASAIGRCGAGRAVGSAVGRNAIAFLIPCHRVIREEGRLGGYRWGPARKEAMLGWEAART